jgi:hypothetical protein
LTHEVKINAAFTFNMKNFKVLILAQKHAILYLTTEHVNTVPLSENKLQTMLFQQLHDITQYIIYCTRWNSNPPPPPRKGKRKMRLKLRVFIPLGV